VGSLNPGPLADDRYELEERLGHGGMATVYRAHDRKLGRPVAIKLLADNLAGDDEIRRRFMREARLAAKLDHPNVVQVFDVGEEDGRPFIVMEHVDGGTLAHRLERRRRGLPSDEALTLLCQMCEGLGHAHDRKLVHRDVKPQNLLLRDSDGCLKIADFGIARAAEETTRLTRPGKVIGTDRYMAPEQLADGRLTAATDVYACGVVADEVLPANRSDDLHEIIDRCLREDPKERFPDAAALGEALGDLNGSTIAPTGRALPRPGREARTRFMPRTRAEGPTGLAETSPFPGTPASRDGGRGILGGTRGRLAAAFLVGAALVIGALVASGVGSNDPASKAVSAQQSAAASRPEVPQRQDPGDQARALADWLRTQGR
jgi:protein kinase-like protein